VLTTCLFFSLLPLKGVYAHIRFSKQCDEKYRLSDSGEKSRYYAHEWGAFAGSRQVQGSVEGHRGI
jgi:hypothetical protein